MFCLRKLVFIFLVLILANKVQANIGHASRLLDDWQLEDALELTKKLLVKKPDDPVIWALAGKVLHHQGDHLTALKMLNAAREQGIDTGYVHQLVQSSAAYAAHFQELNTKHFTIRYLNKDEILAHYAASVLEKAYANIGAALEILVAERGEKIVVEIFPDTRGLAGATGLTVSEIATSGTIAVCKFHRLMITSPLATAAGYNWADTLAHEFVHLVISKKSHNNIPIWLHEGIAKYYESLWKGEAGESLGAYSENLLAQATKKKKFITYAQMHPSMAKLPSQEDAALAFAEVFTTIEFLVQRFGPASIPKLLKLTGNGMNLEVAVRKVFKLGLNGIEQAWRKYLRKRKFTIVPGAKPQHIRFITEEKKETEETPLETMKDQEVHNYSRLGELLQIRGNTQAAIIEYEKAYKRAGLQFPTLVYRLARAYNENNQPANALSLLQKVLDVHPNNGDANLLAGRISIVQKNYQAAQKYFEMVRLRNPFNPEIHAALMELYQINGQDKLAEKEKYFLKLSRKPRPTRVYELPTSPSGTSRVSIITASWGDVRLDGSTPLSTPLWEHYLDAGSHTIEYLDKNGNSLVHDFKLSPGDNQRIILK